MAFIAVVECPEWKQLQVVTMKKCRKGEILHSEIPLAQTMGRTQLVKHNDRPAWHLVEQIAKDPNVNQIWAKIWHGKYETGIVDRIACWEQKDDIVMKHIAEKYTIECEEVKQFYDIIATNNLVAQLHICRTADVEIHLPASHGFFELFSRLNHACEPSAKLHPPSQAGSATHLVALRDLEQGDAVTIDYLTNCSLDEKRTALMRSFGFACRCIRCIKLCGNLACNELGTKICGKCHSGRYCGVTHAPEIGLVSAQTYMSFEINFTHFTQTLLTIDVLLP